MRVSLPSVIPALTNSEESAKAVNTFLNALTNEFKRFADKNIDFRVNCKVVYVEVTTHAVAGTEFTVTHNLGVVQFMHISNVDKTGAVIYDSRRVDWSTTEIFLKCDATSVALRILVLG